LHRLRRPKTSRYPETPRISQPPATYAANADRWVTLPGEYDDCDATPVCTALSPLVRPGVSDAVVCGTGGPTVLHLGGIWHGRIAFEGSTDAHTWQPITLHSLTGDAATEATRPGIWRTAPHTAICLLRVRVITLTAGNVTPAVAGMMSVSPDMEWIDAAA
jgi:hypothetical protein